MNALSCADILAGRAPQDVPVTLQGWVRTRRDSKAGISFVHLSDGSSFHPVQVVAPNTLPNYASEVARLTAGCAVEATGMIVPSPAKGQPFEMQASAVRVVGWVDDPDSYPIQPKPHTLEFLREVAHLRPRTNVIGAVSRVRHTIAQAVHRFFDQNGFVWINTPIITVRSNISPAVSEAQIASVQAFYVAKGGSPDVVAEDCRQVPVGEVVGTGKLQLGVGLGTFGVLVAVEELRGLHVVFGIHPGAYSRQSKGAMTVVTAKRDGEETDSCYSLVRTLRFLVSRDLSSNQSLHCVPDSSTSHTRLWGESPLAESLCRSSRS